MPTTVFEMFRWPYPVTPALREAVSAAYGWPKSVAQDPEELVTHLTKLNRQISEGEREYHPFKE